MSAQVIRLADHRRGSVERKPVAPQAELLRAPCRLSVATIGLITVAAAVAWCAAFFPLLWMAS